MEWTSEIEVINLTDQTSESVTLMSLMSLASDLYYYIFGKIVENIHQSTFVISAFIIVHDGDIYFRDKCSPPLTAASPDTVEKMMMETMIIIMMDLAPVAVDVKGRDVTPMCSSRIMCG